MHSNFNELEADSNFRSWLKECKCPDEIISDILKKNSRWRDRTLEEHIKSCPKLFTALLDNGYKYEAIKHIFLDNHYSGYHWDRLAKQEDIAIELVKNKCKYLNIPLMCQFKDSKKFFNHKEFYIRLLKKLSPLPGLRISNILGFFVVDCSERQLEKCMSNQKLLNLLIENYLPSEMLESILQKDDYRTLNIKNNKELLDLLLREELIFSDKSNQYDRDKKDLVTKDTLIHKLLQINDLTIHDLLYPSDVLNDVLAPYTEASCVRKKAEENAAKSIKLRIKIAQINLPNEHPAKAEGLAEQVLEQFKCNQNEVPSLLALSTGAILNPQEKKILEKPQIEKIKTSREKRSNGCCNIL